MYRSRSFLWLLTFIVHSNFFDYSAQGVMHGAVRLILCEASTRETRPDHNTGINDDPTIKTVEKQLLAWLY